ncbi:hypothetical protein H4Q26_013453 [Puccinia striiformis f. sp. tritici PST-130]|nr:hypothetical protein H4Q26_013453 [Puccinia striiformis f. sp. tritici PST-130]
MSSAASSPTPQRPERYLPTYNTTTVISQPGLERWSPESDENGTILHFCAHNRGERRLQELRRVMYQGLPIGGPRRRPPTRGPIPPPSLVLTQRIPTPTNVFDTNEEERSSETAGRPSPDPNEASVNSTHARNQALQGADNPHGPLALRPTTLQDQLRLAHGRLNMLQHQFSPIPTSLSNWEEFDHEIQLVKAKSAHYQEAYANAILSRDAELFDGINTLSMIPEAERRMPTYDEVMNQLQFIVHTELDDILGSDG